jgi:hypothetical protein
MFNILNKSQQTPSVNGNAASRGNPLLRSSRTTPEVQIPNPSVSEVVPPGLFSWDLSCRSRILPDPVGKGGFRVWRS